MNVAPVHILNSRSSRSGRRQSCVLGGAVKAQKWGEQVTSQGVTACGYCLPSKSPGEALSGAGSPPLKMESSGWKNVVGPRDTGLQRHKRGSLKSQVEAPVSVLSGPYPSEGPYNPPSNSLSLSFPICHPQSLEKTQSNVENITGVSGFDGAGAGGSVWYQLGKSPGLELQIPPWGARACPLSRRHQQGGRSPG